MVDIIIHSLQPKTLGISKGQSLAQGHSFIHGRRRSPTLATLKQGHVNKATAWNTGFPGRVFQITEVNAYQHQSYFIYLFLFTISEYGFGSEDSIKNLLSLFFFFLWQSLGSHLVEHLNLQVT